ncbi:36733_t:CDS:2, partial [Racocetra persica]
PIIDEYVVDKVCVKEKNDNRRVNNIVDMRSIVNVLKEGKTKDRIKVKDENINNEKEENIVKTFRDKAIQIKNKILPVESNAPLDVVVKIDMLMEGLENLSADEFEVNDNGGKAADGKANHYENEKGCNDLGFDYKNEESIGLK